MSSDLGDYLRARRADARPQDLGFPVGGRRQVTGLRREEVAVAAGMSVDYYVRLEQGRETNPSPQVLDSLGRVLALDDDGRLHLFRLAGLHPAPAAVSTERAATELLVLLDSWPQHPALVLGRAYDVLAANTLGQALFAHSVYRDNVARMVFLDPSARSLYVDWPSAAAATVAGLRLADGAAPSEPRLRAVIQELREKSPDFDRLWSTTDARGKRLLNKQFLHPEVGPVTLQAHSFDVRAAPGQELVVYQAEPGSASADALGLLSALAATAVSASRSGT